MLNRERLLVDTEFIWGKSDENVLKWIVLIAAQLCECTENLQIVNFKCVNAKM